MKAQELLSTVARFYEARMPLFTWGAAGIGKSSIHRQFAMAERARRIKAAGLNDAAAAAAMSAPDRDGTYFGFIDFRATLYDRTDLGGFPGEKNGRTVYSIPPLMPSDGAGIILADELNQLPTQEQGPFYQFILDRRIGDYRLPDGWQVFAAGNRTTDRGVSYRLADPLIDRFTHVTLETDLQQLCAHLLTKNVRAEVVAFLRFRPQLIHVHDSARACIAFATPRGYEEVSKLLDMNLPEALEAELIRGRIGDAQAGEFLAFLKLFRQMVSPDQILLNPLTAEVPTNAGVLYALAEALARRSTAKNLDSVLTYASRIPLEYAQALVSSATRLTPALCNTHEFIAWTSKQAA